MEMYFIAIVLPEELDSKILTYKEWMLEHYGCRVGLKSPAHITLVPPFWMQPQQEGWLLQNMDSISAGLMPFTIKTEGFAAFKPRTIFIQPALSPELQYTKKKLDDWLKEAPSFGAKADNRPFHPHITIATRDLNKWAFADAWPHFQNRKFESEWTATGISILRHNKKNWDVIYTSQFKNIESKES